MVQQLNYAIRAETGRVRRPGTALERLFLVIYNADSRPHPATLRAAAALIAGIRNAPGGPGAADPAVGGVHREHRGLAAGLPGMVLAGAGWLQSRWTLSREIPRLRSQAGNGPRHRGRDAFAAGALRGPRPDDPAPTCTTNLAACRSPPSTRISRSATWPAPPACRSTRFRCWRKPTRPSRSGSWLGQARQWFASYPQYPRTAALAAAGGARHARPGAAGSPSRDWHAARLWLGQSPAVALALVLPFTAHRRGLACLLVVAGLAGYYALPSWLAARAAGRPLDPGRALPGGLVAMLLSSAGPWRCLADVAVRRADRRLPGPTEDRTVNPRPAWHGDPTPAQQRALTALLASLPAGPAFTAALASRVPRRSVSAIVPTWNRCPFSPAGHLADNPLYWAVASLRAQAGDALAEIVVVDDGSTDHTGKVVELLAAGDHPVPVRPVACADHAGAWRARNLGAAAASCRMLYFGDDDCVFPPHTVAGAAYALTLLRECDPSAAAVSTPFYYRGLAPGAVLPDKRIGTLDPVAGTFSTGFHAVPASCLTGHPPLLGSAGLLDAAAGAADRRHGA